MRYWQQALSLAAVLSLAGCATTPRQKPLPLTGDILVDGPNAATTGPARDRVLWQYRTAAAAMREGQMDLAKQMLDAALSTIQSIYGKDAEARKARGYFHSEARKTFYGEPYERSMAYFYRGILYWRDGEIDNARACFRSAEFEDSYAADTQFAADWVLPDYLEGYATTKLGGDGSEALKRAQANAKGITLPTYEGKANVLFFIEFGQGPVKYATGDYGEQLRFRPGPETIRSAELKIGPAVYPVAPTDNVSFQATTRGGRAMDHILGSKAVFKSTTGKAGDVALISGAILASQHGRNSVADEVGVGLLLAGAASKIFSAATIARADIRTWDNLPHALSFAKLALPPGQHTATIEFKNNAGVKLGNLTKTVSFTVPDNGRDAVVFVSDRSKTPQTQ